MHETPAQAPPRSEEEAAADEAKRKAVGQGKGGAANTINIDLDIPVARVLGMEEIAEGVETIEQAAHLRELGCRFAQGYLFSKPLPAEAVVTLLAAEASKEHSSPER